MVKQRVHPRGRASGPARRQAPRPAQLALHLVLLVMLVLTLYPVLSMLLISFKNPLQWLNARWAPTVPLRVQNFQTAWDEVWRYLLNTVVVATAGCAGMLALSSLSAFVFARLRFPGRNVLYVAILVLLMIPGTLSLVPAFMLYKSLGLLNTYWVMIVPTASGGSVFGVFLLRTFFASLPEELFEAARMDGAGVLGLYWRICLPLSYPVLGTLAIMNIVGTWNSFIWPLVTIQNDNLQVITVGLFRLTQSLTSTASGDTAVYGPLFAGYVLASLPLFLLFLFTSKYYIEGLMSSALKL